MHPQTRNLLAVLSEETTDLLLEALRNGPMIETELVDTTGSPQKTANRHLKELERLQVVASDRSPPEPGRRGPRPRVFRVSDPSIFRFCDIADEFALALIERQASEMRKYKAQRRARGGPRSA